MRGQGKNLKKKIIDIAEFMPSLIRQKGWEVQVDLHSIFPNWRRIAGEAADYAEPEKIVKHVLYLRVENSAWIQQLQYHKLELLDRLNAHLRLSTLKDIKFALAVSKPKKKKKAASSVCFEPPSTDEQEAFSRQIAIIEDEKIRESLMRIWYLAHSCKRKDESTGQ